MEVTLLASSVPCDWGPRLHIAGLIINGRRPISGLYRQERWQRGVKCPLMNFPGTCILATHFITSRCSWARTVIHPRRPSSRSDWREAARLPKAVCISPALLMKKTDARGAGTLWLVAGAGDQLEGTQAGPEGGRPSGSSNPGAARAEPSCADSVPSAPGVWVFSPGLLSCNGTHLEVGTFAHLLSQSAARGAWGMF